MAGALSALSFFTMCLAPLHAYGAACESQNLTRKETLPHSSYISSIAWSKDNRSLATIDRQERRLYAWDIPSGKIRFKQELTPNTSRGLLFSADDKEIYAVARDGENNKAFTIFDSATGARIRDIPGNGYTNLLALNPAGTLLTVYAPYQYSIYETKNWDLIKSDELKRPFPFPHDIGFTQDGSKIWFAGKSGFFDEFKIYSFPEVEFLSGARFTLKNTGDLNAAALSPDGKYVALGIYTGLPLEAPASQLEIRSFENWEAKLVISSSRIDDIAYHPNGDLIAATGDNLRTRTIKLFSLQQRKLLSEWPSSYESRTIAFSPDGTLLAYGDGPDVQICAVKS